VLTRQLFGWSSQISILLFCLLFVFLWNWLLWMFGYEFFATICLFSCSEGMLQDETNVASL
jgi:hypothetical protein